MTDTASRPPIAIRITRPYATEDEFLESELETLTRTSIVLIGAQSRPQGVVLRFEVLLANGAPILRGEGRVVGYKDAALFGLPGLTLRFTKLDSRSKALVDRAAAIRDTRAQAALREAMGEDGSIAPPPPAPSDEVIGRASDPALAPPPASPSRPEPDAVLAPPSFPPVVTGTLPPFSGIPIPPSPRPPRVFEAPTTPPSQAELPALPAPHVPPVTHSGAGGRDALLLRLRERGRGLSPEQIAKLLKA